jgi:hypothetical protein
VVVVVVEVDVDVDELVLVVATKSEYLVGWSGIIALGFTEKFFDEFASIYLFP